MNMVSGFEDRQVSDQIRECGVFPDGNALMVWTLILQGFFEEEGDRGHSKCGTDSRSKTSKLHLESTH
jgi:hypothetical protein